MTATSWAGGIVLVQPEDGKEINLRGLLVVDGKPVSETWTYRLGPSTDLRRATP